MHSLTDFYTHTHLILVYRRKKIPPFPRCLFALFCQLPNVQRPLRSTLQNGILRTMKPGVHMQYMLLQNPVMPHVDLNPHPGLDLGFCFTFWRRVPTQAGLVISQSQSSGAEVWEISHKLTLIFSHDSTAVSGMWHPFFFPHRIFKTLIHSWAGAAWQPQLWISVLIFSFLPLEVSIIACTFHTPWWDKSESFICHTLSMRGAFPANPRSGLRVLSSPKPTSSRADKDLWRAAFTG